MANQARPEIHQRIDNDFGYHKATPETGPMHDEVRSHFKALAHWAADWVPASREQSLMLTALQEAQMWANAAIACNLSPLDGEDAIRNDGIALGAALADLTREGWHLSGLERAVDGSEARAMLRRSWPLQGPDPVGPSVSMGMAEPEHQAIDYEITIDRSWYRVDKPFMSGAELRQLPTPALSDDVDLWEVVRGQAGDVKVAASAIVEMRNRHQFFTAPAVINPGAQA